VGSGGGLSYGRKKREPVVWKVLIKWTRKSIVNEVNQNPFISRNQRKAESTIIKSTMLRQAQNGIPSVSGKMTMKGF